ncbi:MAG: FAD-dependent oxidoreductase, partial [Acidobacteriota bacterium]
MQITVVGGGIIGCAAAWRLAQGGARVTVCDRGRMGGEASWAGAGLLAPGGECGEVSRWGRLGVASWA